MKMNFYVVAAFSVTLLLTGCKKDDETPVSKVTYEKDVKPIFVAKCGPCHLAGGGNPNKWDDYATAKSKIATIIDRVSREEGSANFMPKGGKKLHADTIAILTKWMNDGTLEK